MAIVFNCQETGETLLCRACSLGTSPEVVTTLLETCGASVRFIWLDPCEHCAVYFHFQKLIFDAEKVNLANELNGMTPVAYACQEGHLDTVRYLVERHAADLALKNTHGSTTLLLAARSGGTSNRN